MAEKVVKNKERKHIYSVAQKIIWCLVLFLIGANGCLSDFFFCLEHCPWLLPSDHTIKSHLNSTPSAILGNFAVLNSVRALKSFISPTLGLRRTQIDSPTSPPRSFSISSTPPRFFCFIQFIILLIPQPEWKTLMQTKKVIFSLIQKKAVLLMFTVR